VISETARKKKTKGGRAEEAKKLSHKKLGVRKPKRRGEVLVSQKNHRVFKLESARSQPNDDMIGAGTGMKIRRILAKK